MSTELSKYQSTAPAAILPAGAAARPAKISVRSLNFFYGKSQALFDISIDIRERMVTAFIGPSGCGKSTFLRTLNRMNDIIPGTRVEGQILIDNQDIYAPASDVVDLRLRVRGPWGAVPMAHGSVGGLRNMTQPDRAGWVGALDSPHLHG